MTTKIYLKSISLFVILTTITSCNSPFKHDLDSFGLNGKVKIVLEKSYTKGDLKFGEWKTGGINEYGHNRVEFDKNGKYIKLELLKWHSGDEFLNEPLPLALSTWGHLLPTMVIIPTWEFGEYVGESRYDEDGELLEEITMTQVSSDMERHVSVNNVGEKIMEGKHFHKNNKMVSFDVKYYKDGKIDSVNNGTFFYKYDISRKMILLTFTNMKGETTSSKKYQHVSVDDNNNWTKRYTYDSRKGNEPTEITTREYEYHLH